MLQACKCQRQVPRYSGLSAAQPNWDLPTVNVHNAEGSWKGPLRQGSQGEHKPCVCSMLPLPPPSHCTSSRELCSTTSVQTQCAQLRLLKPLHNQTVHVMGAAFDAGAAARSSRALSIGEVDLRQPLPLIEVFGGDRSALESVRSMSADAGAGATANAGSHTDDLEAHASLQTRKARLVGRCTRAGQEHGMFQEGGRSVAMLRRRCLLGWLGRRQGQRRTTKSPGQCRQQGFRHPAAQRRPGATVPRRPSPSHGAALRLDAPNCCQQPAGQVPAKDAASAGFAAVCSHHASTCLVMTSLHCALRCCARRRECGE